MVDGISVDITTEEIFNAGGGYRNGQIVQWGSKVILTSRLRGGMLKGSGSDSGRPEAVFTPIRDVVPDYEKYNPEEWEKGTGPMISYRNRGGEYFEYDASKPCNFEYKYGKCKHEENCRFAHLKLSLIHI